MARIYRKGLRTGTARFGIGLAVVLAGGSAAPAAGANDWTHLTKPWPERRLLQNWTGRPIRFPSSSPFAPDDLDDPAAATGVGTLYLPKGKRARRSAPIVILLHGSAGVRDAREHTYGRQFAAMGMAAIVVDVFAARNGAGRGFVGRLMNITETMMLADAFAALRWAARQYPSVDPARGFIMGFSYGGMAAMYALDRRVTRKLGKGLQFAGHISFYGPCIARFQKPQTTGAPILMMYGTADELIDPKRCRTYLDDMKKGGSPGKLVAIKGAPHQWDGGWPKFRIGRQLHGCRLRVEPDGTARDMNTGMAMRTPSTRMMILGLCSGGPPYLIGRDDRARRISNGQVGLFMQRILNGKAPFRSN